MVGPPSFKDIGFNVKEVFVRVPLWLKNLLISVLNLLKFHTNCFIFICKYTFYNLLIRERDPNSVKENISLLDLSTVHTLPIDKKDALIKIEGKSCAMY